MDKIKKLYQLLENSASQHPDNTALIYLDKSCTYSQLNSFSDAIKQQLDAIQIPEGSRVAICSPKSIEFVASIFGILKSGAAYLPIDYSSPIERNKYIVENAEVAAMIIVKSLFEHFENSFTFVADIGNDLILVKNKKKELKQSPNDLAYILYTSGSTEYPKV